jgi:hypothetical protein
MAADAENRPMEQQNPGGGGGGGGVALSSEQDVLNIPDVPRKTEDTESHTQTGDETGMFILSLLFGMTSYA